MAADEAAALRAASGVGITGTCGWSRQQRGSIEGEVHGLYPYLRAVPYECHEEINRLIMDELVHRYLHAAHPQVGWLPQVIGRMKDEGCDAVVLGCTEIPPIVSDTNSPLRPLDSTRLLPRRPAAGAGSSRT